MRTLGYSPEQKEDVQLIADKAYDRGIVNVSDFIEEIFKAAVDLKIPDGLTLDEKLEAGMGGDIGREADAIIIGTLWDLGFKIIGRTHEGTVIRRDLNAPPLVAFDLLQPSYTLQERDLLKLAADILYNKGVNTLEEFYDAVKDVANAIDADVEGFNEYELLDEPGRNEAIKGYMTRIFDVIGYTIEGDNWRDGEAKVVPASVLA